MAQEADYIKPPNNLILNLYNTLLETEKIKNDQYKNIIENSGLFTFLNNLRTVDINKDNVKIYRNLMNTKKNLLTNISKISSNLNAEFENFSQNKENEVTTPEEIRYLQNVISLEGDKKIVEEYKIYRQEFLELEKEQKFQIE